MIYYILTLVVSFLVDVIPFVGPPAWTVMVFFQLKYDLNIWLVLVLGVAGSAAGRYVLSVYMPVFFSRLITEQKKEDMLFLGNKLSGNNWKVQLFILLYTLVPLPSTPLFTAAGIARIRAINIIPSFIIGKFSSDMVMVLSGNYAAQNAMAMTKGLLSWQSIAGCLSGILVIVVFLCIDWRSVFQNKRLQFNFNIWRHK